MLGAIALLLIAAALLQFVWHVALSALIWAPPAFLAIAAGWWVFQWSESVEASVAAAVAANMLVRMVAVRMVGAALRAVSAVTPGSPEEQVTAD